MALSGQSVISDLDNTIKQLLQSEMGASFPPSALRFPTINLNQQNLHWTVTYTRSTRIANCAASPPFCNAKAMGRLIRNFRQRG